MYDLIVSPEFQDTIQGYVIRTHDWLEMTDGIRIPLKRTVNYLYGDYKHPRQYQ